MVVVVVVVLLFEGGAYHYECTRYMIAPLFDRSCVVSSRFLFGFLRKVAAHSEANKMTSENLAIVWAPNLVRPLVGRVPRCISDMLCRSRPAGKRKARTASILAAFPVFPTGST